MTDLQSADPLRRAEAFWKWKENPELLEPTRSVSILLDLLERENRLFDSILLASNGREGGLGQSLHSIGAAAAAAAGGGEGDGKDGFKSAAEIQAAFDDPRYQTDANYRNAVIEKLARQSSKL